MRLLFLFFISTLAMAGEISGVVIDGTRDNQNGKADLVNLVSLDRGMVVLGSVPNATGAFTIPFDDASSGKPMLLQAIKDGVTYTSSRISPDTINRITVYDASPDAKTVITLGSVGIYAYDEIVEIGSFYELSNIHSPPTSLLKDTPVISFRPPLGHTELQASTQQGEKPPLKRPLSLEDGVASSSFAVKPGQTIMRVHTRHAYKAGEKNSYVIPLLPDQNKLRLLLLPLTMSAEGEGITLATRDEQSNVSLYTFQRQPGQTEIRVEISGTPDTSRGDAVATNSGQSQQHAVENTPNHLSNFRFAIMGSIFLILVLASLFGLRN